MYLVQDEDAQTVKGMKKALVRMEYSVHGVLQLRGLQLACQHELSTFHLLQGHWRWGLWTMFLFDWKWRELASKRQGL